MNGPQINGVIPRAPARLVAVVLAASAVLVAADVSNAARKRRNRVAKNLTVAVVTPLGLQGSAGAGERVVLPFRLVDRASRRVNVEVEYGIDLDGDGEIADGSDPAKPSEFRPATQARRDPRDTGRTRARRSGIDTTYRPSRGGASHGFVWDHVADLGVARVLEGARIRRDATGRAVPDPFEPGAFLFTDSEPGVVLRLRATRRGGKRQRSDWAATDAFSLDNSSPPSMTIDNVPVVDLAAGLVEIDWTAFDDDSEDLNGNGALDLLDLEDRNVNGVLDTASVAVAFDFVRLRDGEIPPTSPILLERLDWQPCTRAPGVGDPDDGIAAAPSGVGRSATFVWDIDRDLGGVGFREGSYVLRATPYDDLGNRGEPVYRTLPIVIGEAK